MTDKDLQNVLYILNRSQKELLEWWNTLQPDDQDYAIEIITEYRKLLDSYAAFDDEHIDVNIAKAYLKKFQL